MRQEDQNEKGEGEARKQQDKCSRAGRTRRQEAGERRQQVGGRRYRVMYSRR